MTCSRSPDGGIDNIVDIEVPICNGLLFVTDFHEHASHTQKRPCKVLGHSNVSFKIGACSFSFSHVYVASQVQVEATKEAVAWRHSSPIVAGLAFRMYDIRQEAGGTMYPMDLPCQHLLQWNTHMEW